MSKRKMMVEVGVSRNGAFVQGVVGVDDAGDFLANLLDLFRDASMAYPELTHELQPVCSTMSLDTEEDDWAERGHNGRHRLGFRV
jgi:hypothetical protein